MNKTSVFLLVALSAALICGVTYAVLEVEHTKAAATQSIEYAQAVNAKYEPFCRERVVNLPEDGHAWYTTLFVSANYQSNPRERELVASFQSVPELRSLAAQTHFALVTPQSRTYGRYKASTGAVTPCVIVQQPDGKVVYKSSGPKVPDDSWRLIDDIREAIRERFPHCPQPKPDPAPVTPPSTPPATVPTVPDLGPSKEPESTADHSLAIALVAGVLSIAVGIGWAWRRESF